ncbi:RecQ family ATP-dependent DNA helicase [Paenibacillus rhizoplanae]|uniref:ATP-dependent DNA helicase RecQ n=1 Tax=Paenibacillus rhizoplanae TaxID=1917181 RepID=A0ABW5FGY2_9BACL
MREIAEGYLKQMLGDEASFHQDQYESIEAVISRQRTLVVQKTGWGKSIVYFISTKILRDSGSGITILISPLLSLMRNQIESAKKIGINAVTLNSSNEEEWDKVEEQIQQDKCDILLISPERLSNNRFQELLQKIEKGIGLFVIDEAHCISNWGHDFRPDYRRIVNIVNTLPANVPVLATTATANSRVIADISSQVGAQIKVIRGPLIRESLQIQVIRLQSQAERLAWLAKNIPNIDGSGIIYCSTTADCRKVAKWLRTEGIDAYPYYAKVEEAYSLTRPDLERKLMNDEIKVLVSTDALGMGFDKPNLSFVIHFQRPGTVVAYYQQIGRAGRALENAYAVLLTGEEDNEIQEYFINAAFPSDFQLQEVLNVIEDSDNGVSVNGILKSVNIGKAKAEQCLKLLEIENFAYKSGSKYYRSVVPFNISSHAEEVTAQRYRELEVMEELCSTSDCYMDFIAKQLDDNTSKPCGRCANCKRKPLVSPTVEPFEVAEAVQFLKGENLIIQPRKRWPIGGSTGLTGNIGQDFLNNHGRALSQYGDAGWGKLVKEDRYTNESFSNELIEAAADFVLNKWKPEPMPDWVAAVPSLRHPHLVPSFASKLATRLGIPYYNAIEKVKHSEEQKNMRNSLKQVENIFDSFKVVENICSGNVLLVDDIMNSGWTFSVCGYLLRKAGSGVVYPFALSSTGGGSDAD